MVTCASCCGLYSFFGIFFSIVLTACKLMFRPILFGARLSLQLCLIRYDANPAGAWHNADVYPFPAVHLLPCFVRFLPAPMTKSRR